jgi:hypothetical protein
MTIFYLAVTMFALATGVSAVIFDRLLRHEYTYHRAHWENRGCPCGMFWWPRGGRLLSQNLAAWSLLLWNPPWFEQDPKGRELLVRFRIVSAVSFLALVATWLAIAGSSSVR